MSKDHGEEKLDRKRKVFLTNHPKMLFFLLKYVYFFSVQIKKRFKNENNFFRGKIIFKRGRGIKDFLG